jgi:hypothetical protein
MPSTFIPGSEAPSQMGKLHLSLQPPTGILAEIFKYERAESADQPSGS